MHLELMSEKVAIPEGVTATAQGSLLTVKGEKGEITRKVGSKKVAISVADGSVVFTAKNATRNEKCILRTGKAHTANMLRGVAEGHTYKLKICSGHFPMSAAVKDGEFVVKNFIGEKVPRVLKIKEGCEVVIDGEIITVTSHSKELAGNQAGGIELLMHRPGFDKRIFQDGIYITEKDGKAVGQ